MATAYFVGLKKKKLYHQYLGNATPITIKTAHKKTGATAQMLDCNIHHKVFDIMFIS